jgi:hypothetical protein
MKMIEKIIEVLIKVLLISIVIMCSQVPIIDRPALSLEPERNDIDIGSTINQCIEVPRFPFNINLFDFWVGLTSGRIAPIVILTIIRSQVRIIVEIIKNILSK